MHLPDFLTQDPNGEIFLTGHRVTLYHIVTKFHDGHPPEMIAQWYPTVSLATIYKVAAFVLEHQDEVDKYVETTREAIAKQAATAKPGPTFDALKQRLASRIQRPA